MQEFAASNYLMKKSRAVKLLGQCHINKRETLSQQLEIEIADFYEMDEIAYVSWDERNCDGSIQRW